jgi:hypothetical protein
VLLLDVKGLGLRQLRSTHIPDADLAVSTTRNYGLAVAVNGIDLLCVSFRSL